MGLYQNIDIDFAQRTLKILDQYDEQKRSGANNFEVTLLVNCLVGLLILPHERRIGAIPDVSFDKLNEWNIDQSFVKSWGKMEANQHKTLREFIHRLRNSVAHFQIEAEGTERDIERLKFADRNGFTAVIPVNNLKAFVKRFAEAMSKP